MLRIFFSPFVKTIGIDWFDDFDQDAQFHMFLHGSVIPAGTEGSLVAAYPHEHYPIDYGVQNWDEYFDTFHGDLDTQLSKLFSINTDAAGTDRLYSHISDVSAMSRIQNSASLEIPMIELTGARTRFAYPYIPDIDLLQKPRVQFVNDALAANPSLPHIGYYSFTLQYKNGLNGASYSSEPQIVAYNSVNDNITVYYDVTETIDAIRVFRAPVTRDPVNQTGFYFHRRWRLDDVHREIKELPTFTDFTLGINTFTSDFCDDTLWVYESRVTKPWAPIEPRNSALAMMGLSLTRSMYHTLKICNPDKSNYIIARVLGGPSSFIYGPGVQSDKQAIIDLFVEEEGIMLLEGMNDPANDDYFIPSIRFYEDIPAP